MFNKDVCNICGSKKRRVKLKVYNRVYTLCLECGLIYRFPLPQKVDIIKLYKNSKSTNLEIEEKRDIIYKEFLKEFKKIKPFYGKLLDVGCGYGTFIKIANKSGWEVAGIELSTDACEYISKRLKLRVYNIDISDIDLIKERFDLICMWNVLDHLIDPLGALLKIKGLLEENGVVYIRVPNFQYHYVAYRIGKILEQLINNDFAVKTTIFHIYCFTSKTLSLILKRAGFRKVHIRWSRPSYEDPYRIFSKFFRPMIPWIKNSIFLISKILFLFTQKRLLISPSIEALAQI